MSARRSLAGLGVIAVGVAALEVGTARSDWEVATRRILDDSPGWVRTHWLNAPAVTASATLFLVVATIIPLLINRRRTRSQTAKSQTQHERKIIIRRVRYIWINSVLNASLADAARLALGLRNRSDMISLGRRAIRPSHKSLTSMPDETAILEVFDKVAGALLILGAPGSGKTTLLLTLAEALLDRAEAEPTQPVPVVFNLSSWQQGNRPLTDWLASELSNTYKVPFEKATTWIEEDAITPLLDGLDEVAESSRAKCAEAINNYRNDHGLVQMAVCCRTDQFEHLDCRVDLDEAVELLPPTSVQIDTYLNYLEATGTPLADVRSAMSHDEALQEMLRSPLMLHVVALAYHGRPALALNEPGSSTERRTQLWDAYVARTFEQRPLPAYYTYGSERAINWLSCLAQALRGVDRTQFRLDLLSFESVPIHRRFSSFWHPALFPVFALAFFSRWDMVDISKNETSIQDMKFGQPIYASFWAAVGVGIATGLLYGAAPGAISAIATGLLGFVVMFINTGCFEDWDNPFANYHGSLDSETAKPNAYTWYAATSGAAAGICAFLISGLLSGIGFGLVFGTDAGYVFGVSAGIWFGICWWLIAGGFKFLSHFVFRYLMVMSGAGPWRYKAFLDAMTERLLLRRVGVSYQFVHLSLRDHLADRARSNDAEKSLDIKPSSSSAP
jgi:GTPase SAR1 family protein